MSIGTLYCSLPDVQRVLSAPGVNYRIDDDPTAYPEVIDEASREMDFYLLPHYDPSYFAANNWIRHSTAILAAVLFCERRGNNVPKGIDRKLERLDEKLNAIAEGRRHVPGLARRRGEVPTLGQPRIKLDPHPHTVIERRRSSRAIEQPTVYPRHDDRYEYWNYQI